MILAVAPVIKKIARTMPESCRPREPHPYNLALVDFMVQQFTPYTQRAISTYNGNRRTTLVPDLETEPFKKTKAGIEYHNDLMELASLLPWPWYDGIIIFGEVSPSLLKRIQGLFKKTFFSSMPETPCAGKWLKSISGRVFYVYLGAVKVSLVSLLEFSFKGHLVKAAAELPTAGIDAALIEQLSWHAMIGKKATTFVEEVRMPACHFRLTAWALFSESVCALHRVFLAVSSEAAQAELGRPPLLDFVTKRFSPITVVVQYATAMLKYGDTQRMILLLGDRTMQEWKVECPDEALIVRRGFFILLTWTLRRNAKFGESPFTKATFVDDRLCGTEIAQRRSEFIAKPPCHHDPYMGIYLHATALAVPDILCTSGSL